jgi:hypothetical protein
MKKHVLKLTLSETTQTKNTPKTANAISVTRIWETVNSKTQSLAAAQRGQGGQGQRGVAA